MTPSLRSAAPKTTEAKAPRARLGRPHLRAAIVAAKKRRGHGRHATLSQRLADGVANTVGSWRFIVIQSVILVSWITANAVIGSSGWDPYPFILLNLALSFQAAYTAPIIMMSQNRQQNIDRGRVLADYEVNIRSEAEIMHLHEKIDLLREKHIEELTVLLREALARLDAVSAAQQAAAGPQTGPG